MSELKEQNNEQVFDFKTRYPWLRIINLYTGKVDDKWTIETEMPEGWLKAFGEMMCEELDAAIKKAGLEEDFRVLQIKEKYGSLRFYCSHTNDEIGNIISKYELLSSNICLFCGKPDVPMLDIGWISPFCKDCFDTKISDTRPYEKVANDETRMADKLRYRRWSKETGEETIEIDISETAEKIRKRWEERQKEKGEKN